MFGKRWDFSNLIDDVIEKVTPGKMMGTAAKWLFGGGSGGSGGGSGESMPNYDFNYNIPEMTYSPSEGLLGGISDLQGASKTSMGMGKDFMNQYNQMIDPNSSYYKKAFGLLREDMHDFGSADAQNRLSNLAMAGIGSTGGMASKLRGDSFKAASEGYRKGTSSIYNQGLSLAGTFGGLANQATATGISGYGRAGGLLQGIDNNMMKTDMFNTQNTIDRNRYRNQMGYEHMMADRYQQDARKAQRSQNWWDLGTGLLENFGDDIWKMFAGSGTGGGGGESFDPNSLEQPKYGG